MIAEPSRDSIVRMMQRDERVQKMHDLRKEGKYSLAYEKLTAALINMQANRQFPVPSSKAVLSDAQTTLLDWRLETQAIFSRASAIKMQAFSKKRILDEHINRVVRYLSNKYGRELKRYSGVIKTQQSAVHAALQVFYQDSYALESLIQLTDILIKDLDNSSFAANLSYDVVNLRFRAERNI